MTERTATMPKRYLSEPLAVRDEVTATPVPINELVTILSYRRPGGSEGERSLIEDFILPLVPEVDGYGNLFLIIPTSGGDQPNVAFTAHTDTVHRDTKDLASVTQPLTLLQDGKVIGVDRGQCLGADDGTGVWILLNLIEAGVPGLYCFFRDEEIGRVGSEWSAKHDAERYAGIDMMLSFDRAGTTDIITHQMGQRCCSEAFATALGLGIDPQGDTGPDPTGSFTDSYSFLDMIPECTNVSVGYDAQHSSAETQDLTWCSYLVDRLIQLDFAALPVERDPLEEPIASTSMADLLETFPDAIADLLETYYGITPDDILNDLADLYGVSAMDIEDRIAMDKAIRYEDFT